MKNIYRFLQVAVTIVAVTCLASVASAQSFWQFGKKYTPKFEENWINNHIIATTYHGEGTLTAVDGDGNALEKYVVIKDRPVAGPFTAGSYGGVILKD